MKTEYYFCDKCKKEVTESKELQCVTIYKGDWSPYVERYCAVYKKFDLCADCCALVGAVKKVNPETKEEEPPTLQDRLFDIVAELVATVNK